MGAARIELAGVSKRYGEVSAVTNVSLNLEAGTLTTLLGPSGCGKTTVLRMLAGLEFASQGSIRIGGRDVTRVAAADRNVSMVFQSYALFPHMTVLDNVSYGLTIASLPKQEVRERALAVLSLIGLSGYEARWPAELSGGQQQRVAIARALVLEPEVLLFDEPLSNLDTQLRRSMRKEIRDLQKRLQLTVVYVTHDQSEALAISDHVVVMHKGRVAQVGTPEMLYREPQDAFVATFLGDCNLAGGHLLSVEGGMGHIRIGDLHMHLPHRGRAPGPVQVAIRPQGLQLVSRDTADGLPAKVTSFTFLGSVMEIELETQFGPWLVIASDQHRLALGSEVNILLGNAGTALLAA